MKKSTKRIVMVLIGAYLAYTGFDLTRSVIRSAEKNKWIFLAFAALFLVFGAAVIIMNIKALLQEYQSETMESDGETEEEKEPEEDRHLLVEDTEKKKDGEEDCR